MLHTSFQKGLAVHHTLVVVFCNSFAVAKCNNDCIVCSRKVNVLDSSCSICRVYDRFSFGTVVYRDTSLNCFFVGCIQSQRNIVKIALQQLNSPFHDILSIILSRSDVYIKVNGTSIQLLFCSL